MKHVWSVLCERAIVDQESNRVSHMMCTDNLRVEKVPFVLPWLAISSLWSNTSDETSKSHFKVVIVRPDGQTETPVDGLLEAPAATNQRTIVTVRNFEVKSTGVHYFQIHQKTGSRYKKVADIPFIVTQAPEIGTVKLDG